MHQGRGRGAGGGDQLARGCVGAGKDTLRRFAAAGFRKVLNARIRHHLFSGGSGGPLRVLSKALT